MQLLLILGIVFATGAVTLALQNNVPVTLTLASLHYDSSLAIVLLVALGLGALIAGLVSTPSVLKGQWAAARLRRQVVILEEHKVSLERRILDMESMMPQKASAPLPPVKEAAAYVGMRDLIMAREETKVR